MNVANRPLDELQEVIDSCVEVILLVQGKTAENRPFWAYLALPPGRVEDFKAAEAAGAYRLNDWGRVLRSGGGREPSALVRLEMMRDHGVRDDFEAAIEALLADRMAGS